VHLNYQQLDLEDFLNVCWDQGVGVKLPVDLSHVLVEFYIRGRSKKALKYADALCEAAMQRIRVGELGLRLGNVGPHGMRNAETPTDIKHWPSNLLIVELTFCHGTNLAGRGVEPLSLPR
jgi:hypothetical protein